MKLNQFILYHRIFVTKVITLPTFLILSCVLCLSSSCLTAFKIATLTGGAELSLSLQMIERPLMTADELKSMPKGQFIVMKTGVYPMKVKLQLFFKWGIKFEEAYAVNERGNRMVKYASSKKLISSILEKYPHTSNKENRPYAPPGAEMMKQVIEKNKEYLKTNAIEVYQQALEDRIQ